MMMLEQMASAMAADYGWDWGDLPDTSRPGVPEDSKEMFLDMARAALVVIHGSIIAALKPFAECAGELDGSEDTPRAPDGEWAKFRLLTDDYRRARDVAMALDAAILEDVS